jgi:hypothetical protein
MGGAPGPPRMGSTSRTGRMSCVRAIARTPPPSPPHSPTPDPVCARSPCRTTPPPSLVPSGLEARPLQGCTGGLWTGEAPRTRAGSRAGRHAAAPPAGPRQRPLGPRGSPPAGVHRRQAPSPTCPHHTIEPARLQCMPSPAPPQGERGIGLHWRHGAETEHTPPIHSRPAPLPSTHSNGVRLSLERSPAPSAQMGGLFLSPSSNQGGAVPPGLPLISPTAYSLQPATCRQPPTAPGFVLLTSPVGLGFPSASSPDKSAAHSARPRLPSVLQAAGWPPSLHALLTDTACIIYSAWHAPPQPARGLFPLAPPTRCLVSYSAHTLTRVCLPRPWYFAPCCPHAQTAPRSLHPPWRHHGSWRRTFTDDATGPGRLGWMRAGWNGRTHTGWS